jgi:hypothetical protein
MNRIKTTNASLSPINNGQAFESTTCHIYANDNSIYSDADDKPP